MPKDTVQVPAAFLNITAQIIGAICLGIDTNLHNPEKIFQYLKELRDLKKELQLLAREQEREGE
jgi:hypothetical protein